MAEAVITLSQSELKTWSTCRRRWWLAYYRQLQLRNEPPTGVVHVGSHTHLALEGYYGYNLDALQVLRWSYDDIVAQQPDYEKELRKDFDMASAMVEGYLQWAAETGLDVGLNVAGTEHELIYPVTLPSGQLVTWRAKLDLLMRRESDNRLLLRDWKTVGDFGKANALILDQQMRFYAMLQALVNPDPARRVDGAQYLMMKRSKRTARATGPFFQLAEVSYNRHDLNSTYLRAIAISQEILVARQRLEAGEDHRYVCYPTTSDFCTWGCAYYKICNLFDDGSRSEAALAAEYEHVEPYHYYDTSRIQRAVVALGGTPTFFIKKGP